MSSKISNHFKNLKRKRTGAESTEKADEVLEIQSDGENGSDKVDDDPKEIYKKVASGQIRGTYKPLEQMEPALFANSNKLTSKSSSEHP